MTCPQQGHSVRKWPVTVNYAARMARFEKHIPTVRSAPTDLSVLICAARVWQMRWASFLSTQSPRTPRVFRRSSA